MDQIVTQLVAFLRYLLSLWGILSAFSTFFPLVNKFRKIIPPPVFNAEVCILLATMAGIVVVLIKFVTRRERLTQKPSLRPFFVAISITLFYTFILYNSSVFPLRALFGPRLETSLMSSLAWQTARMIGQLFQGACYIYIFYKFTDSFTTLAVHEYQARERERLNRSDRLP